jgi:hypothetical protein
MKPIVAVVGVFAMLVTSGAARAGVYSDDLSKCLVRSATPTDQTAFVAWAFSAMSAHPAVSQYSNFTQAQRDELNQRVGKLYERLLTVDCHAETVAALKYEGANAMEQSFSVLGQVAFRGLMTDPAVTNVLSGLGKAVDTKKIEALAKEAGVPIADKK